MMFPYDSKNSRLLLVNHTEAPPDIFVGTLAEDGTIYVNILLDEDDFTGIYGANGAINVVEGAGKGVYSPCGALNVTIPTDP